MTWSDTFLDVFKKNDVRFISYVPDNVLTPLIKSVTSDNYLISVNATQSPVAFILSPLLSGGNPVAHTRMPN